MRLYVAATHLRRAIASRRRRLSVMSPMCQSVAALSTILLHRSIRFSPWMRVFTFGCPNEWRFQTYRQAACLREQGSIGLDPAWVAADGQAALADDDVGSGAGPRKFGGIHQISAARRQQC